MSNLITSEKFNLLLERLSTNQMEAGEAYTKLRDSLARFFELKGDIYPDEAADETIDRVALKVSQNGEIPDITKFSFGVARLIFLERCRKTQKEKSVAHEFYADKLVIETNDEDDDFTPFHQCFDRLKDDEKKLLQDYFADVPFSQMSEYRQELSDKYNISLSNLRVKVFRLRERLEECIKRKFEK